MRRIVAGIILTIALGVTGCATSGHRDSVGTITSRSGPWSPKTTSPAQTRVSLPPEPPDLFMPSADSTNHRGLSHFFPTLGRNTSPRPGTTARFVTPVPSRPMPASLEGVAHANTGRPSLFGGTRKSRVPQTYMTDVRTTRVKSSLEPAFLPVALQIPVRRQADQAVTPTSADLLDETDNSEPKPSEDRESVPANPDASDAKTQPLSTTEPQLAIDPMDVSDAIISPPPATEPPAVVPSAESTTPPPEAAPEPAAEPDSTRDEPARDPRERPRLSARPIVDQEASRSVEPAAEPTKPEPAATVAARPTKPDAATDATRVAQARPSVADPGNSLGLPPVTLPPTYTRQVPTSAPQGSYQAEQPLPVLASPQVAPTPQGGHGQSPSVKSGGTTTRTWRVPSVRRLVRRIGGMGEFASPPTAKPH